MGILNFDRLLLEVGELTTEELAGGTKMNTFNEIASVQFVRPLPEVVRVVGRKKIAFKPG